MTILILGGTTEANALARALAGRDVVTSLAGRTDQVPDLPGRMRVGGFGGPQGLADFLRAERIAAVIDATHPFAAGITAHAAQACATMGVPRLMLVRPQWDQVPGDCWIEAENMADAAQRLPGLGQRAFLTVGVQELAVFAAVPGFKLARLIQARDLPGFTLVAARGPFAESDEIALMTAHAIDVVVTKQSGGAATYAKIAAARALGIPVLMIRRPPLPQGERVERVDQAVAWLDLLSRPQHMGVGGIVQL